MVNTVLRRVFRHPRYVVGALGVSWLVFTAALLLPNWSILTQVLRSDVVGVTEKLFFTLTLYGTFATNFTVFSGLLLTITALLFGINIALLTFYIRRRQEGGHHEKLAQFASMGGLLSALLGIGCAACGSVILTGLLGLLGAGGLLLLLPFHGVEFGVLGVVLLVVSIRYLMKRIMEPLTCPSKY